MKAVEITKPHEVRLIETEKPIPAPGFARIKIKAAAICATDLEVVDGNIAANYPLIPGHEWSGIVDAVGSEEDSHWIGKSVIGSSDVVCLKCDACRRGEWRYCKNFEEIGFKRNGAYAEYAIFPVYGLVEKPENVPFENAALCEPLGVALGTLKKAHAKAGQTMLIFGAGSIGLCMLAAGKALGMRNIVVCATRQSRLEIAKEMGAYATVANKEQDIFEEMKKLHPDGTDVIIDATGAEECISAAFKLARKGGVVALAGYGGGKVMNIRIDDIHINNLKVIGAGNNWNMHKRAAELMADGVVDLSPFITKKLKLSDFKEGLELARKRPVGFIKAVFVND